ncbi:hypothetical protein [Pseudalkalibacillus hwajinpoensis]|uniref:Uncharacterized protein n=1 Tax=Guptibacillus hwajinpoensis TaxID=208199 RepID=A0A4U1MJA6_9BACL|nr:hypothetical protein [Pseudalkalibacillus hwajinpoensis]TKD70664.1 hypothetical protein FBF83_08555 [Pseudalkalibacillus hwajinpoensis]
MIRLGENTFVSYILGKRIKVIAINQRLARLYINDEYKGKCELSLILKKINSFEKKEQDIRGMMRDEQKLYSDLGEIIKNQKISPYLE